MLQMHITAPPARAADRSYGSRTTGDAWGELNSHMNAALAVGSYGIMEVAMTIDRLTSHEVGLSESTSNNSVRPNVQRRTLV